MLNNSIFFNDLKAALISSPVLAYPNFDKPFFLITDASNVGMGAARMQLENRDKLQPPAYDSRVLNRAESNYSLTSWEALAVVWALKHFHGYEIHVRTYHAAVVERFNTKSLTGKVARWALTVQDFNPKFAHVSGAVTHVADALSRCVGALTVLEAEHVAIGHDADLNTSTRSAQRTDPFCVPLIRYLESEDQNQLPKLPVPLIEFELNDNLLVRHTYLASKQGPHRPVTQIVIPERWYPLSSIEFTQRLMRITRATIGRYNKPG